MLTTTPSERAFQLERDFRIRHPRKTLFHGLRTSDLTEITPLQLSVAHDRVRELIQEFIMLDACIILLMRDGRRECIAAGADMTVEAMCLEVRDHLHGLDTEPLIAEAQRCLSIWRQI